jgi:hypothetical protein
VRDKIAEKPAFLPEICAIGKTKKPVSKCLSGVSNQEKAIVFLMVTVNCQHLQGIGFVRKSQEVSVSFVI